MISFGIKDVIDILLVAFLLYYIYRLMKRSSAANIFTGIIIFILVWIVVSQIFSMRLLGTILDKLVSMGALALVVLFQEEIRKFLYTLGAHQRFRSFFHYFKNKDICVHTACQKSQRQESCPKEFRLLPLSIGFREIRMIR